MRKFAQKYRTGVAFAGGLVVMLVLGVVGLIVGLLVVNEAKRQAESAKQRAEREQQRTHKALDMVDTAVEGLIRTETRLGPAEKEMLRGED